MAVQKTRETLIDIARQLFARKGLEETTMNDIAVASGKGRRTLYTYFKSKEELFDAVVATEMEHLSEEMTRVAKKEMNPEDKLVVLIYTHLDSIKEVVQRNGNIRAEFFRDIWRVSLIRQRFDSNERHLLKEILTEGCRMGVFEVEDINLVVNILHYAVRGLEVPYIYGRLETGLPKGMSRGIVQKIIHRAIGMTKHSF